MPMLGISFLKMKLQFIKFPLLTSFQMTLKLKSYRVRFIKIPFKPLSKNNEEEIVVSLSISKIKIILSNSFLITAA